MTNIAPIADTSLRGRPMPVVTVDKPRSVIAAPPRELDTLAPRRARAETLRIASDVANYGSYIVPISSGVVASMTGLDTLMMYGIGFAVGFGLLQAKGVLARMSRE